MTVSGAITDDSFATYFDQVLVPMLIRGNVVVLDNLPARKMAGLSDPVEARLLYLLLYSPDFNPIELPFSKCKTWLRTAQARTQEALSKMLSSG